MKARGATFPPGYYPPALRHHGALYGLGAAMRPEASSDVDSLWQAYGQTLVLVDLLKEIAPSKGNEMWRELDALAIQIHAVEKGTVPAEQVTALRGRLQDMEIDANKRITRQVWLTAAALGAVGGVLGFIAGKLFGRR